VSSLAVSNIFREDVAFVVAVPSTLGKNFRPFVVDTLELYKLGRLFWLLSLFVILSCSSTSVSRRSPSELSNSENLFTGG